MPHTLFRFICYFLLRQKLVFGALCLISLMWAVEQVLFPYVMKMIIDVFTEQDANRAALYEHIWTPLGYGALLWLASTVAWRLSDWLDYYFSPRYQADVRTCVTEYVFGHSHRYFSENLAGSLANKIADLVRATHYLITQSTRFFIPNLVLVFLTAAIMASIEPMFAAIIIGWTAIHLSICAWFARACDEASHVHSEIRSELQGRIVDSISNFITVRLFARRRHELGYIGRFQQDEVRAHRHMIWIIAKVKMILEVPCFIMMVLMLYYLFGGWQQGRIGTGDAAFILTTTINLMYILWRVGMEFPSFYREIGVCQQALSLVATAPEITDLPNAAPLAVTAGAIEFENVYFQYHNGQNLFRDKNITIRAGEKVGLVGFSGSGKTTFANLILRLYALEGGRILIDGQDIAHATQDSLREHIALVPQEPVLFHRSLRENIAYARPHASEAEIIAAARQAHCHEFITANPGGYDAIVGERGVKLSGGQRQRIAIARAILKNAPILIFDEATSSLDSFTEAAIQQSMQAMMEGRTTIVIAHRLSTLTAMDRLLVFREGSIVEDGTHAALLAAGGHYSQLWNMQIGGFLPDKTTE